MGAACTSPIEIVSLYSPAEISAGIFAFNCLGSAPLGASTYITESGASLRLIRTLLRSAFSGRPATQAEILGHWSRCTLPGVQLFASQTLVIAKDSAFAGRSTAILSGSLNLLPTVAMRTSCQPGARPGGSLKFTCQRSSSLF